MEGEESSMEGKGGWSPPPAEEPLDPSPPPGQEPSDPSPPPGQEPSDPSPLPADEPSDPSPPPGQEPSDPSPPPGQEPSGPSHEEPAGAGVEADEEEDQEEVEVTDIHTQTKHKPLGGTKKKAAKTAVVGLYIGWRCPEYLWDCFRVGELSKCFCGHLLREHQVYVETRARMPCIVPSCKCQSFIFIPSRPEDVGEFWLRRRAGFDPSTWQATCRCQHGHEEHAPSARRACRAAGCWCVCFESNFLCAACDRRWEEHKTFFETAETRRKGGRPFGEAYLPFAEMPELRNTVLTGHPGHSSAPQAPLGELPAPSSHDLPFPSPGLRSPAKQSGKKA
ncbi:protein FAM221B isoform X3 [Lepidochelys kempii]|uniref:protein FAM221B isoform X3 n=1 Tax=Lepidochelys kempii TaxID=8472 RepID=UPI003C6EDF09